MQYVVASLEKGVESDEERVGREFPLAVRLGLVLEIRVFELGANVDGHLQFLASLQRLFPADELKDERAWHELSGSGDDLIAYLADEHHQPGRAVVEFALLPDQQDGVHDGEEDLIQLREFSCSFA